MIHIRDPKKDWDEIQAGARAGAADFLCKAVSHSGFLNLTDVKTQYIRRQLVLPNTA
jgi:hypothetical protein